MGRAPCCSKVGLHRGPWTANEDSLLINYIQAHGEGQWRSLPKKAGLLRCGKSCRLRWLNYLRPDIKRGNITPDEDDLIIRLHALLGNKWSLIAGRLPGRTDNEIKNYWNTYLSKKLRSEGTDPNTHKKLIDVEPGPPKRRRVPTNRNRSKEERTKVHMPKAVRVTSWALKRDDSLASFESNATTLSASTTSCNHGEAVVVGPYWPSDESVNVSYEGVRFMIGCDGEEDPEVGVQAGTVHPHASDLDKIYDEYLQLLKVDDDHCVHADQEMEFDCFAESLLI